MVGFRVFDVGLLVLVARLVLPAARRRRRLARGRRRRRRGPGPAPRHATAPAATASGCRWAAGASAAAASRPLAPPGRRRGAVTTSPVPAPARVRRPSSPCRHIAGGTRRPNVRRGSPRATEGSRAAMSGLERSPTCGEYTMTTSELHVRARRTITVRRVARGARRPRRRRAWRRRQLLDLAEEGKRKLVVDLSEVTFMDSTGISVILNAVRQLATRHGSLVLVCPTEQDPAALRDHRSREPAQHRRHPRRGPRWPGRHLAPAASRRRPDSRCSTARTAPPGCPVAAACRSRACRRARGSSRAAPPPAASRWRDRPSWWSAWSCPDGRGRGRRGRRQRQLGQLVGGAGGRLVVAAAAGEPAQHGEQQRQEPGARGQRSTAGSRRPQWGQSFRSFWTSCSSEQPHRRRFSTA